MTRTSRCPFPIGPFTDSREPRVDETGRADDLACARSRSRRSRPSKEYLRCCSGPGRWKSPRDTLRGASRRERSCRQFGRAVPVAALGSGPSHAAARPPAAARRATRASLRGDSARAPATSLLRINLTGRGAFFCWPDREHRLPRWHQRRRSASPARERAVREGTGCSATAGSGIMCRLTQTATLTARPAFVTSSRSQPACGAGGGTLVAGVFQLALGRPRRAPIAGRRRLREIPRHEARPDRVLPSLGAAVVYRPATCHF
jgi:hypothetical protein